KRGWLSHWLWRSLVALRLYPLQRIDWARVERVVFVCAGNICRSPLADARARMLGRNARSAGTRCDPGHPVDRRLSRLAPRYSLVEALEGRSTPLADIELTSADLVVAMEPRHLAAAAIRGSGCQKTLLGVWLPRPRPYL